MQYTCKNSDPFFWNKLQDKETFKYYTSQLEVIYNLLLRIEMKQPYTL